MYQVIFHYTDNSKFVTTFTIMDNALDFIKSETNAMNKYIKRILLTVLDN